MIVSVPAGNTDVEMVTLPPESVPEPRFNDPLVNVTVPVAPEETVAVIDTGEPYVLGPEVVTVTVGVFLLTVCVKVAVEAA